MMSPMRLINETEIEMKPKSALWLRATTRKITLINLNRMEHNHVFNLGSHWSIYPRIKDFLTGKTFIINNI